MSAVDIIDGRGYILNVEFGGGKDGVDGKDGRDGVAPDLQIGTVKESEDDQPHVTISDEGDGKLSLNFDLVSGKDGQNGEDGGIFIPSVSQEGVISWIAPEGQNPPQAVSVKGETGATFTPTVSIGGEISWTNDKGLENPYEQNIRGPKGEKGDPFTIYKVYNSKTEMDADYSNPDVPMGAFVCITNSVDQSENARLYVKGTQEYTFITDLSGATGMHGVPGVGIGRVGLMDNQPSPLYKEYGVWSDQTPEVLLGTFNLPVGEDGQQGNDGVGIESIEQTTKSHEDDGVNVITVKLTDGKTSTFNVENGSKGSTGAQGPAGQDGQNGQDGVGIDGITVEQSTFDGQPNVVTVHLSDDTTKTFNVYNGHTGATGTAGTLNTNNISASTPTSESMSGNISLHKISKTGDYNDLRNKPTIPAAANDSTITIQKNGTTVNTFTLNQSSPKTINMTVPVRVTDLTDEKNYVLKSSLATVATSGSYSDLSNRPVIGNAELTIRSVDNTTPETYTEIGKFHANAASPEYITLSKVARTGSYNDLKDIPRFYGSEDLSVDEPYEYPGTSSVYTLSSSYRKFHFDLIADYLHVGTTFSSSIITEVGSLSIIGTINTPSYMVLDTGLNHENESDNLIGYDQILLPAFKKTSAYKLQITQFTAAKGRITSIGQQLEWYIKYGSENFGCANGIIAGEFEQPEGDSIGLHLLSVNDSAPSAYVFNSIADRDASNIVSIGDFAYVKNVPISETKSADVVYVKTIVNGVKTYTNVYSYPSGTYGVGSVFSVVHTYNDDTYDYYLIRVYGAYDNSGNHPVQIYPNPVKVSISLDNINKNPNDRYLTVACRDLPMEQEYDYIGPHNGRFSDNKNPFGIFAFADRKSSCFIYREYNDESGSDTLISGSNGRLTIIPKFGKKISINELNNALKTADGQSGLGHCEIRLVDLTPNDDNGWYSLLFLAPNGHDFDPGSGEYIFKHGALSKIVLSVDAEEVIPYSYYNIPQA